jgi:hypothetical protein
MIRHARRVAAATLVLALAGAAPAPAQQEAAPTAAPAGTPDFPIYVPPDLGAPSARVGGGTRGGPGESLPTLEVLAPDHVALTAQKQPVLHWYLSADTSHPLEFSIRRDDALEPLKEVQLPGPHRKGIHALSLAAQGVSLEPDADYRWFVSLVPDRERRSNDVLAGGMIRRRELPAQLGQRLEGAGPSQAAFMQAESGLWYDALASLARGIEAAPADKGLHAQRAALLDQVGLADAAAYDRSAGK